MRTCAAPIRQRKLYANSWKVLTTRAHVWPNGTVPRWNFDYARNARTSMNTRRAPTFERIPTLPCSARNALPFGHLVPQHLEVFEFSRGGGGIQRLGDLARPLWGKEAFRCSR